MAQSKLTSTSDQAKQFRFLVDRLASIWNSDISAHEPREYVFSLIHLVSGLLINVLLACFYSDSSTKVSIHLLLSYRALMGFR